MFKRIYLVLISGALLVAAPNSVNKSSNIKKIIKNKDKIVVIIRENGKDKRVVLDAKTLAKITSESKSKNKDKKANKKKKIVAKQSTKKVTKKTKTAKKTSKSTTKISKKAVKHGKYKVVQGDTLFSIAKKYKVSISDLAKINKLGASTLIHPGDIIKIPSKGYTEIAKEEVSKNKKTVYKVKKGDTLYSVAKLYNMKPSTVRSMNNLKRNPKLKPGMELTVLGKPSLLAKRKKATKYMVKKGDTVWRIAREHGLTIAQLKLLNPKLRRGLKRGSILKVSKIEAIKLSKKRKHRLSGVLAKYQKKYTTGGSNNSVVRYAKKWLGSRYVWGASRPGAFDCSGFTSYVMRHAKGRVIPRVSRRQAYYGKYVSRRNLRAGDLIFFDTSHRRRGYVNHVAIYIGNNMFIHASSAKHRVVITSLNKPFYRSRFMWGRRIN